MPALKFQKAFFRAMAEPQDFRLLFEHLPDVFFFVKDARSRFVAASRAVVARLGCKDEAEIIGKGDRHFYPPEMADQFARDDRQVVKSGQPLIGRVEVCYDGQRILDWFVTTKLPVFGRAGRVLGIMGITHSFQGQRAGYGPFAGVAKAVEFIHRNYREKITMAGLARAAGISGRQLNRRFNDVFGITPYEFILRTRVQGASEALLRTDASVLEIAIDFGFCDQSALTTQFRGRTGMTPGHFRKRYARTEN